MPGFMSDRTAEGTLRGGVRAPLWIQPSHWEPQTLPREDVLSLAEVMAGGRFQTGDAIIIGRGTYADHPTAMVRVINDTDIEFDGAMDYNAYKAIWMSEYVSTVFPDRFSDIELIEYEPAADTGSFDPDDLNRIVGDGAENWKVWIDEAEGPHRVNRLGVVTADRYYHMGLADGFDGDPRVDDLEAVGERVEGETTWYAENDWPDALVQSPELSLSWQVTAEMRADLRRNSMLEFANLQAANVTRPADTPGIGSWQSFERFERLRPSTRAETAVDLLEKSLERKSLGDESPATTEARLNQSNRAMIVGFLSAGKPEAANAVVAERLVLSALNHDDEDAALDELVQIARQAPEGQREWPAAAAAAAWKLSGRPEGGWHELDEAAGHTRVFAREQELYRPLSDGLSAEGERYLVESLEDHHETYARSVEQTFQAEYGQEKTTKTPEKDVERSTAVPDVPMMQSTSDGPAIA